MINKKDGRKAELNSNAGITLNFDVQISESKIVNLVISSNDDIEEKVKVFCDMYNLKGSMRKNFNQQVINDLDAKIAELEGKRNFLNERNKREKTPNRYNRKCSYCNNIKKVEIGKRNLNDNILNNNRVCSPWVDSNSRSELRNKNNIEKIEDKGITDRNSKRECGDAYISKYEDKKINNVFPLYKCKNNNNVKFPSSNAKVKNNQRKNNINYLEGTSGKKNDDEEKKLRNNEIAALLKKKKLFEGRSREIINQMKIEKYKEIFEALDNDKDGLISSKNIKLSGIEYDLLKELTPLFKELQSKKISLNFKEFCQKVDKYLSNKIIIQEGYE